MHDRPAGDGLLLLRRALLSAASAGPAEGAQLQQRGVVSNLPGVSYLYVCNMPSIRLYLSLSLSPARVARPSRSHVASAVVFVYLRRRVVFIAHALSPSRDYQRLRSPAISDDVGRRQFSTLRGHRGQMCFTPVIGFLFPRLEPVDL